jgi:hypothetical protein
MIQRRKNLTKLLDEERQPLSPGWRPLGWPIAQKISQADAKLLADSLGLAAARLDPKKPLAGAKRIFWEAGKEAHWSKRHRFITLPNDRSLPSHADRRRVAIPKSPEPFSADLMNYVKLSEGAFKLEFSLSLIDKTDPRWLRFEDSIFLGSTFRPRRDVKKVELISKYSRSILAAVETDGRLSELFAQLKLTPFDADLQIEDIYKRMKQQRIDGALQLENGVDLPELDKLIKSLHDISHSAQQRIMGHQKTGGIIWSFKPIRRADGQIPNWAIPKIFVGTLAFEKSEPIFVIPPSQRDIFHPSLFEIGDEGGRLSAAASDWLCEQGWSGDSWGYEEFEWGVDNERTDFGWKSAKISLFLHAHLRIDWISDGELRLVLEFDLAYTGEPEAVGSGEFHAQQKIAGGLGEFSQISSVHVCQDEWIKLLHVAPYQHSAEQIELPPVFGLLAGDPIGWGWLRSWPEIDLMRPDEWNGDVVQFLAELNFFPDCAVDEGATSPFSATSLAHALMANQQLSDPEIRWSNQLIQWARVISAAGHGHLQKLSEDCDVMLDSMADEIANN